MKKYLRLIAVILPIVLIPLANATARDKVRIGGNVVVEEGTEVKDAVAVGGSVTVNGKVRLSAVPSNRRRAQRFMGVSLK